MSKTKKTDELYDDQVLNEEPTNKRITNVPDSTTSVRPRNVDEFYDLVAPLGYPEDDNPDR